MTEVKGLTEQHITEIEIFRSVDSLGTEMWFAKWLGKSDTFDPYSGCKFGISERSLAGLLDNLRYLVPKTVPKTVTRTE